MEYAFTKQDLLYKQAQPLATKIQVTQAKVMEWYMKWKVYGCGVYLSFSGGKDSTVLADLTARICKMFHYDLTLVFVDTGLEYPEIRKFVPFFAQWLRDTYGINVELVTLRPEMTFDKVLIKFGYPVIGKEVASTIRSARLGQPTALLKMQGLDKNGNPSEFRERYKKYQYLVSAPFLISHYCCNIMKKNPAKRYEKETGKKPIIATMAEESQLREKQWLQNGCNAFDIDRPVSTPLSPWVSQDVLLYLKKYGVPYCEVYGEIVPIDPQLAMFVEEDKEQLTTTGCDRTGCMYCMFGITCDKNPNRFQRMKQTHPRQYNYCINGGHVENGLLIPDKSGLGIGKVLDYIGEPY